MQECLDAPDGGQVHGFPRVMGVLTHLDGFRNDDKLKKVKKTLKHRFWTEIYQGASLSPPPPHRRGPSGGPHGLGIT